MTSALHVAAQKGHDRITRMLLQHGADCNLEDHCGQTPLMLAVIAGHEDVAGLLLAGHSRVNIVDHQRRSALHWAVVYKREAILNTLISQCLGKSDVLNARDRSNETPLHIAINSNFEPGVKLLLESGAGMILETPDQ
ncbi:ankyrin repeat-containing protein [Colletotrichum plurivorum]|uniref:Ankyrin repeat-containing protein n=1 Tax=Colletotrichum plurivorum TaxID=2175906 RepID=A0A8H6MVC1_9PEZI|nr:ankyrin repeat-containing protein [Colletotrichum plurivorum]